MHPFTFLSGRLTRSAALVAMSLAVLGGLSSCTTYNVPVTPELAKAREPGEGFIVAGFTLNGITRDGEKVDTVPSVEVFIRGTGATKGHNALLVPRVMSKRQDSLSMSFAKPNEALAIPVPAGSYEITGWRIMDAAPGGPVSFMNRLPMSVPFEVRAGEATYIGRANSLSIYGKNIIGMRVPGEALVIITDAHEKDIPRISRFYPSIPRSSIRRSGVPARYKEEMKRISDTPEKFFGLF